MPQFKLHAPFNPTGGQPNAIAQLVKNLQAGAKDQVLLGVTGSGKTFTMANVIEKIQKPTLIISHNKTLAAQLYQEFKEFFPQNSVNYFVSYYDYYQPEAYIPTTDTYIDKDAKINEELDRLRHSSIQNLLDRPDTIIVASVSCIYNIGLPNDYLDLSIEVTTGQTISRQALLRLLTGLQYSRQDINFGRGSFRVRGETIEIWPATGEKIIRLEFKGNLISSVVVRQTQETHDLFVKRETKVSSQRLYPAKFWVAPQDKLKLAMNNIRQELDEHLKKLKKQGKLLDAERLRRRTNYDLEMMREVGYCHGIENYSRHLEFRAPGAPPYSLLDYFSRSRRFAQNSLSDPRDFLTIIDESHMTVPQIGAMYEGDKARKQTLIDFGFRLPSALDNRPLKFQEFEQKIGQIIYTSATPGKYEMEKIKTCAKLKSDFKGSPKSDFSGSRYLIEQLIRPTGLLDPPIDVRPSQNQIPDLIREIKKRVAKKQRVLVTTLTKRMAEDLAEYLTEEKIKTQYLHSEIKTLERPDILKKLREGAYDVLVGINLLREGLDLPEVSLVAILDADKEGFLRNATTLIQTIGRASRHLEGRAIMYADRVTRSMKQAIDETIRRRKNQEAHNKKHGLIPQAIQKGIRGNIGETKKLKKLPQTEKEYLKEYLKELQFKMELANRNLQFDEAIRLKEETNRLTGLAKK
ncbi:MAG: excinuclease ABC subunit UvrB [Patescibacteria group bacterium]